MKPRIVLIFGASGSGKSTLLTELRNTSDMFSIHKKGSTRPKRQYDGEEIVSVDENEIKKYEYSYNRYGYIYGIEKAQIENAVKKNKIHVIICNDVDLIEKIKLDFPGLVNVVYLLFDAPMKVIEEIQKTRNISDDEVKLRLEKIDSLNKIFIENSQFFDGVIVNKFGSPPVLMVNQLMNILQGDTISKSNTLDTEVVSEIFEISKMVTQLKNHLIPENISKDGVVQKDYLFIIMAMNESEPILEDVFDAIKRAAGKLNLNAERVDEIPHSGIISEKMLSSIRIAELVVADLTFGRPNCYYELGYAHAFGKKTILTAKEGTELHFDIKGFPVLIYKSTKQLEEKLVSYITKLR